VFIEAGKFRGLRDRRAPIAAFHVLADDRRFGPGFNLDRHVGMKAQSVGGVQRKVT